MRLYLINPSNPLVSIVKVKESRWNRFRVWKPLSLMGLADLSPPEWEIAIVDENLSTPNYEAMPRPDPVGITAFTSQANRAYEVATHFRRLGVPVVMGGIHPTMCQEEAMERVGAVVTGEAESIWPQVLEDARHGSLKRRYDGGPAEINDVPIARQDLLAAGYACGAVQATRGCPLNCSFCGMTAFNGSRYRQRPIADVVREFKLIREKRVLIVDNNLVGTRLGDQMKSENRLALDTFPEDWKYYTPTFPVARYKNLSLEGIIGEMISYGRDFYSMPRILRRVWDSLWQRRQPLISLVGNCSYRNNLRLNRRTYADFKRQHSNRHD
jgi:hypothetical protein